MGVLTASLRAPNSVHTYCTGAAAGKADASEQRRFTPTLALDGSTDASITHWFADP